MHQLPQAGVGQRRRRREVDGDCRPIVRQLGLELDGTETYSIALVEDIKPGQAVEVTAKKADGSETHFTTKCRIDTPVEVEYFRNGGILHYVLRQLAK